MDESEKKEIRRSFDEAVNMTAKELETWLDMEESKRVGWTHEGETEAVGHKSGGRIIEIKRLKVADLSDDDYAHMKKVTGHAHRHLAQGGPSEGAETSKWRYSLMNWGHDPLK